MGKLKNWQRYTSGALIGMIAEYLFRVEFSIPALIIVISLAGLSFLDILTSKNG